MKDLKQLNREDVKLGLQDAKDELENLKKCAEIEYYQNNYDVDRAMSRLAVYTVCLKCIDDMIEKHLPQ